VILLFFVSGAAGLVYEVTWARSLGLVFGASHLAVATVLAVYMGGQALGSALIGARASRVLRPLRLYGALEVGVGASALAFVGLTRLYPGLYGPLARLAPENGAYLTILRSAFAVCAMAVPTTLMGATLPILTTFGARREEKVALPLSLLYAVNTGGAVVGAALAGALLLPALGVTATLLSAAATSVAVGIASLLLDRRQPSSPVERIAPGPRAEPDTPTRPWGERTRRLALIGIGASGFCALGYEVLWTRMLSLVVGTSTYSFTIMLVAFLAGIGAGSHAFGLTRRIGPATRGAALLFASTQVLIGLSALAVTVLMRHLPGAAWRLQEAVAGLATSEFTSRLAASAALALAYMFVPAFFMGLAFPAAASVWSAKRERAGGDVGLLLTANTVGAILGSVVSGFVLIRFIGIERASQLLVLVNVFVGLAVAASVGAPRWTAVAIPVVGSLLLVTRAALPGWGRVWDQKFFATYINNSRVGDSPEQLREYLANTDVLYYFEGVNETVSAIKVKGGVQSFIVNGRPEASTHAGDVQVQKTLGHLPVLLHRNPRRVFILGTGTGMTLGAAAVHPEVERLVLGEIEEGMLGVARTFERWNGHVLDSPKLSVVFNDGRNYLATTHESFDVISADPVHPWSGGAGYLYTREYFRSVRDRLAPGGIACQWLPMYELSVRDVKTVLRTFSESFEHVMVWLTYYDAVLVGSREPFVVDEAQLARRIEVPAVRADLAPVHMGTAQDFLSFFLMGSAGARAFATGGDLNTDDNLTLEFSAPASQGISGLDGANVLALAPFRENLLGYLAPASGAAREEQALRWNRHFETSRLFDQAHGRFLISRRAPDVGRLLVAVQARDPGYAPHRFLLEERAFLDRAEPALVGSVDVATSTTGSSRNVLRISAVRQFVGRERVLVSFVDNERHEIYGQRYIDGAYDQLEQQVRGYAAATLGSLQESVAHLQRASNAMPTRDEVASLLRRETRSRVVDEAAAP
jgi:spermidine synthase